MRSLTVTLTLFGAVFALGAPAPRPQGPCDIYAAANTPCVAAHSTTRALLAAYNGPLYQLKRESDGKTLDVGILPDGFADANKQDAFCVHALCVINLIYDQSGKGNHLYQAPPGPNFPGPAMGGFDTQPIADMAPITIGGHKAYGVFIIPGMGFRNNGAAGIATGDEPEGIYYVIDGTHFDSGCCFDYGNSSRNGRAVGTGTMETTYFGTSTVWGRGAGSGPWIMSDMEAGLFSGYDAKQNAADPTVDAWRFVTAVVDGGGGNRWDLRGGNAQQGGLTTFYSGVRPGSQTNNAYSPMHKQGGILLGTGGDNGNGSSGTFYEGVMTSGYPSEATTDAVQANIVAARYDVAPLALSRIAAFTPRSTQDVTATFHNTTGSPLQAINVSLAVPAGWAHVSAKTIGGPIAPGASVNATFNITSPATIGAGEVSAVAEWTPDTGPETHRDSTSARVRNVPPVKINEIRFSNGGNATNQFVELYNASSAPVDVSNWKLVHTPSQWAPVTLATIPVGTTLAPHTFYLLGRASSGLAAPSTPGATTVHVSNVTGFTSGQKIEIDGETRTIASVGAAAAPVTVIPQPDAVGPRLTVPAGSTSFQVASATGFEVGQKVAIDIGGNYELATASATEGGLTIAQPTRFPHMAGQSVDALGSGLTLDRPLSRAHPYAAPVLNPAAAASGYSGPPPKLWFGAALSTRAGSLALLDPTGKVVIDAVVYGSQQSNSSGNGTIASPELATLLADQAGGGCIAVVPTQPRNIAPGSANSDVTNRSLGRFPDGADTGRLCADFHLQPATTLASPSQPGATNIKVAGVADFVAGQAVTVDTGANLETATIATVGTAGATTSSANLDAGATVVPVAAVIGFAAGQVVTIDAGPNAETATIAAVAGGRGGARITLAAPLTRTHVAAVTISGTGVTLAAPLTKAHASGAPVAAGVPTPAAPNVYAKAR